MTSAPSSRTKGEIDRRRVSALGRCASRRRGRGVGRLREDAEILSSAHRASGAKEPTHTDAWATPPKLGRLLVHAALPGTHLLVVPLNASKNQMRVVAGRVPSSVAGRPTHLGRLL